MSYYIRLKGKAFGPFDEAQLVDMKTKGRVSRTTEISVNKTDWQTAEAFEFLYQPQQTYTPPSPPLDFGTQAPAAQPASTSTAGAGVGVVEPKGWFYSVDGNNGYGPVPQSAIVQMIQNGTLHGEGYVWQEGQTAQFIKSVSPFAPYFGGQVQQGQAANNTVSPQQYHTVAETSDFDLKTMLFPLHGDNLARVFGNEKFWLLVILGSLPLFISSIQHGQYRLYGLLIYFSLFWGWLFKVSLFNDVKNWWQCFAATFFTGFVGLGMYMVIAEKLIEGGLGQLLALPGHEEPMFALLGSIFVTGFSEEICKVIPPAFYLLVKGRHADPKILILTACFSGFGFAVVENISYAVAENRTNSAIHLMKEALILFLKNPSEATGIIFVQTIIANMANVLLRSLSCTWLHGVWCGIFSYFLWYGVRHNALTISIILGLLLSATLHGTYNWFQTMQPAFSAMVAAAGFLLFFSYLQNIRTIDEAESKTGR